MQEVNMKPVGADSTIDIGIFDPQTLLFYKNSHGFLCLKVGETDHRRVKLARILPFSEPYRYISVATMESKEIGILKDVADLSEEQAAIVREELAHRYYCPVVTEILSIKEKMGYFYFDVKISEHKKLFAVKDISKSIKMLDEQSIIITDVDGNRYQISDVWAIDSKSRRRIEPYLY
jgi:hypothetical protein